MVIGGTLIIPNGAIFLFFNYVKNRKEGVTKSLGFWDTLVLISKRSFFEAVSKRLGTFTKREMTIDRIHSIAEIKNA